MSRDVTFHEEATLKRSKELDCDPEMEETEIPTSLDHENDSFPSYIHRGNPIEHT